MLHLLVGMGIQTNQCDQVTASHAHVLWTLGINLVGRAASRRFRAGAFVLSANVSSHSYHSFSSVTLEKGLAIY